MFYEVPSGFINLNEVKCIRVTPSTIELGKWEVTFELGHRVSYTCTMDDETYKNLLQKLKEINEETNERKRCRRRERRRKCLRLKERKGISGMADWIDKKMFTTERGGGYEEK